MKKFLCLLLALLLICCCGCGRRDGNPASGSDLPEGEGFPASSSDAEAERDLGALLLDGGGRWRSEQQTAIDPGVIVRELSLLADGSFTYREGDAGSEFSYFATGSWALEGDFLIFDIHKADESFAELPEEDAVHAQYAVAMQDGEMSLRQNSDRGFSDGQPGMTVYYYQLAD